MAGMRTARQISAPPATTRPASQAEMDLIAEQLLTLETGSGWPGASVGLPSGEPTSTMQPRLMRGMYPRVGYTEQMLRAEPSVYSGFDKQLLTISSLNWDIVPPAGMQATTDDEEWQTEVIREGWRRLPYGFLGHAVAWPFTSRLHGFALLEKTFEIDEDTGLWMLSALDWIPPWCVKAWVLDTTGHAIAAHIRDEAGDHIIEWDSLYYEGQFFWGRNYEGLGIARPIKYVWDHKRQLLVDHARASSRASAGVPIGKAPEPGSTDDAQYQTQRVDVDAILDSILWEDEDDPAKGVLPPGWDIEIKTLAGLPDYTPMLEYLDNTLGIAMTDTLSQLGQSRHGARAVGAEQRQEKWSMLGGLARVKCNTIDYSIHRQWYRLNGWDTRRMCRTVASGLGNGESSRRLLEFLTTPIPGTESPPIPMTPQILDQLDRDFGLPQRNRGGADGA